MKNHAGGCRPLDTSPINPADMATNNSDIGKSEKEKNAQHNAPVLTDSMRTSSWALGAQVKQVGLPG